MEGGRRKRRKGIVAEMMAFLNPYLADRDACCHVVITVAMTERENLFDKILVPQRIASYTGKSGQP